MTKNVNFVPQVMDPPNIPQTWPIESFWGCLGSKVYEDGCEAKTNYQLNNIIKSKLKEFDEKYLQSLMKGIKANLRKIADSGVYATFK